VNDLCSNHLMIDRNTKQILRFSLSATYSGHSDVVTGYIRIQATCLFVPGISRFSDNEEQDEFVFAYRIRISMLSSAPSHYIYRLEQRHWIVTDTDGHVENIRGPGVIGEVCKYCVFVWKLSFLNISSIPCSVQEVFLTMRPVHH